jgi:N-acetylmuramoyl-L-alanine amidase
MRAHWFLVLLIFFVGCQSVSDVNPNRSPLARFAASPNFETRKAQMIIIHHTQMDSFEAALQTLQSQNSLGKVSAHYLIGRDGQIVQLVDDDKRAWHAGLSRWKQRSDLNSASIGIELDNDGYSKFPPAQMDALLRLLEDLCTRLGIERQQVWGHADIAPARKQDPNRFFAWQQLAERGFGLWPRANPSPVPAGFDPLQALAAIGYDVSQPNETARAFNRHFFGHEADTIAPADYPALHDVMLQALQLP